MAKRSDTPGPQRHAEGAHGEKTHKRFIEQLQEGTSERRDIEGRNAEGRQRLLEDRIQHDEAEKGSEKVEAMREIQRGRADDSVLTRARVPHESDSA